MGTMRSVDIEMNMKFMRDMMRSCYTYGGIDRDGSNFKKYILQYKERVGDELFEKIYLEESEKLSKFTVQYSVYTDHEGLTYNSLIPIEHGTQKEEQ